MVRSITAFAGKKDSKTGKRKEYSTPKVLTAKDGRKYLALVFGACRTTDGLLLESTIRFYFGEDAYLKSIVVGNKLDVLPIEQE